MTRLGDVLYVQDIADGTGVAVSRGRWVTVRSRTWMPDGTPINAVPGNTSFYAGTDGATEWRNQGAVGMRVGGRRRVVAGSMLAWGATITTSRCPSLVVAEIEVIS